MKEQKIVINLPNGDQLVAEQCPDKQIAVGIVKDGMWIQDLVLVECEHDGVKFIEDKFNIYVYGSEYDECYTECFGVNRIPQNAL